MIDCQNEIEIIKETLKKALLSRHVLQILILFEVYMSLLLEVERGALILTLQEALHKEGLNEH